MIRRTTLFYALISLFFFSCLLFSLFFHRDLTKYQALLSQKKTKLLSALQTRQKVEKKLYFPDRTRFIFLTAPKSSISLLQKNHQITFQEELFNLRAKDASFDLTAKKGIFAYPHFTAEEVTFLAKTHEGETLSLISQEAELLDKTLKFVNLSALLSHPSLKTPLKVSSKKGFFTPSSLSLEENVECHYLSNSLKTEKLDIALENNTLKKISSPTLTNLIFLSDGLFTAPKGFSYVLDQKELSFLGDTITLVDQGLTLHAKEAHLLFSSFFEPKELLLEKEVRLLSDKLLGIADKLSFDPLSKNITLSSLSENKVLFWKDDLKLSAKEILITPHKDLLKSSIKGIGDVRFSFSNPEERFFQELFSKYLN